MLAREPRFSGWMPGVAADGSSHRIQPSTRREWLMQAGAGFGGLALLDLLSGELEAGPEPGQSSSGAEPPWRQRSTARSVIFLFMEGGPSHIDTFDPKPELNRLAGKPLPPSFKPVITPMGEGRAPLLPSRRKWQAAWPEWDLGLGLAAAHCDVRR